MKAGTQRLLVRKGSHCGVEGEMGSEIKESQSWLEVNLGYHPIYQPPYLKCIFLSRTISSQASKQMFTHWACSVDDRQVSEQPAS